MHINKILSGSIFDIYGLAIGDLCPVQEYLLSLDLKDQKQITALITFIAENGPPTNIEKFKPLGEGIFELKTRSGIRILSFFGGSSLPRSLILTHGFPKPKPRTLQQEIRKAVKWRKEYFRLINKVKLFKKGDT